MIVGLLIDFHIVFILKLETYDHVIVATVSESQYFIIVVYHVNLLSCCYKHKIVLHKIVLQSTNG